MIVLSLPFRALSLWGTPTFSASTKTVIADGQYVQYVMADGDTLAGAEEKVLQRAQRKAVEEAGVYLESTFHDVEKESGGRSTQTSSLEIRTIAAAAYEQVLELDPFADIARQRLIGVYTTQARRQGTANLGIARWPR